MDTFAICALAAITLTIVAGPPLIGWIEHRRALRRDQVAYQVAEANRRIDRIMFEADARMRDRFSEHTGHRLPPPNPFKYGPW